MRHACYGRVKSCRRTSAARPGGGGSSITEFGAYAEAMTFE